MTLCPLPPVPFTPDSALFVFQQLAAHAREHDPRHTLRLHVRANTMLMQHALQNTCSYTDFVSTWPTAATHAAKPARAHLLVKVLLVRKPIGVHLSHLSCMRALEDVHAEPA